MLFLCSSCLSFLPFSPPHPLHPSSSFDWYLSRGVASACSWCLSHSLGTATSRQAGTLQVVKNPCYGLSVLSTLVSPTSNKSQPTIEINQGQKVPSATLKIESRILGGGHPTVGLKVKVLRPNKIPGPQVSPGVFRHGYAFHLCGRVWELGSVCPDTLSQ